jgi:hypothetical protein
LPLSGSKLLTYLRKEKAEKTTEDGKFDTSAGFPKKGVDRTSLRQLVQQEQILLETKEQLQKDKVKDRVPEQPVESNSKAAFREMDGRAGKSPQPRAISRRRSLSTGLPDVHPLSPAEGWLFCFIRRVPPWGCGPFLCH